MSMNLRLQMIRYKSDKPREMSLRQLTSKESSEILTYNNPEKTLADYVSFTLNREGNDIESSIDHLGRLFRSIEDWLDVDYRMRFYIA